MSCGNWRRIGNLAALEEGDGEVCRVFITGQPVGDFDCEAVVDFAYWSASSEAVISARSLARRSASSLAFAANMECTSGLTGQRCGPLIPLHRCGSVIQPSASRCWNMFSMSSRFSPRMVRSPRWMVRAVMYSSLCARI